MNLKSQPTETAALVSVEIARKTMRELELGGQYSAERPWRVRANWSGPGTQKSEVMDFMAFASAVAYAGRLTDEPIDDRE